MDKINEFFKNNEMIMPLLISILTPLLVALLQNIVPFTKHKRDIHNEIQDNLKQKLEKVYTPLLTYLNKNLNNNYIVDSSIFDILNNHGYLLSKASFLDLTNLIKIETKISMAEGATPIAIKNEHNNLKSRICDKLQGEFFKLQSLYNKSLIEYEKKVNIPWYFKIGKSLAIGCAISTIYFYIFFIIQNIIIYVNGSISNTTIKNYNLKTIINLYIYIILFTTLIGGFTILTYLTNKILTAINIKRGIYQQYGDVPKTGLYKCRICNKTFTFSRYAQFHDHKHDKLFIKAKSIFTIYSWKFIPENPGKRKFKIKNISKSPIKDIVNNQHYSLD